MTILAEYDDGSEVNLAWYAGGASNGGEWSELGLFKIAADGTTLKRAYAATGDWEPYEVQPAKSA